ncbi:hypothetical protein COOONC_13529 [Cooperia oncophora]
MQQIGRDEVYRKKVESYLKANKMFVDCYDPASRPAYTQHSLLKSCSCTSVPSLSHHKVFPVT